MNKAKHVIIFTTSVFVILLILSFLPNSFSFSAVQVKNIDLFGDIRVTKRRQTDQPKIQLKQFGQKCNYFPFQAFKYPKKIVDFSCDSLQNGLPKFTTQLSKLKAGMEKKVRIAFIGDSMIEGDLITSDMRTTLQRLYGGNGVGFMPVYSVSASLQSTASISHSRDWTDISFRSVQKKIPVFISGHAFIPSTNSWFSITDKTISDSTDVYLLCGSGNTEILCNNQSSDLDSKLPFNMHKLLKSKQAEIKITGTPIPVYGLSFESETGVIVDNFSFRGTSGIELRNLDTALLQNAEKVRPYDLVILEYGLNVLDDNRDNEFKWYDRQFDESVKKVKACFPNAEILILSCADRAFRKEKSYASPLYIDNLVAVQAAVAYNNKTAFFNLFETMGGKGTMVNWVTTTPSLAYADYMHPNAAGCAVIAKFLTDAIELEVNKVR